AAHEVNGTDCLALVPLAFVLSVVQPAYFVRGSLCFLKNSMHCCMAGRTALRWSPGISTASTSNFFFLASSASFWLVALKYVSWLPKYSRTGHLKLSGKANAERIWNSF